MEEVFLWISDDAVDTGGVKELHSQTVKCYKFIVKFQTQYLVKLVEIFLANTTRCGILIFGKNM